MNQKNVKKRNWAFVAYPESLPDNWREILQLTGLQCVISPLHDSDINDDQTPKKVHYHIILCYSGPTSYNVVERLTSSLNATIPIALEQVKGYYRYLTHKDNPEKYQYKDIDITTINGFDISDYVELTKSEVNKIKKQIQKIIIELAIEEYSDLMDFCLTSDETGEFYDVACSNTLFFNTYITSRRNKFEKINSKQKKLK